MGSQAFFPFLWENIIIMINKNDTFGKRFRELRAEKGLSQIALAKELQVSKSVISLWELDGSDPTLSNLIKISEYFKVSIDFLAGKEQ